jgi:hypothetical protein
VRPTGKLHTRPVTKRPFGEQSRNLSVLKRPVATVPGVSGGRVLLPDQQGARGERGSITLAVAPGAPDNCVKSCALLISERAPWVRRHI